jgi:nucleoside-diphosphate-sugar epimerase
MEKVSGRVFNVGATEQNYQKQQLVELILPHVPDAVVEYVHKTEDPRDYRVSFALITKQLGFQITRTVPQGIAEVAGLVKHGLIKNFADGKYRN